MAKFLSFIYKYRFELFILLCILFLIFIVVFRDKIYNSWLKDKPYVNIFGSRFFSSEEPKKKQLYGKYENRCREIFESLFNRKFPKVRPKFLKRTNGHCLELDGYNEELKLAFEYNGNQHYKFNPRFHRTINDLEEQIIRDNEKRQMCLANGVNLIEIPYNIKYDDLYPYIRDSLLAKGLIR